MSEAKQMLETIITDFSAEKFSRFFREKSRQFVAREESYVRYNDDDFKSGLKLGEINFPDNDSLLVCVFEVKKELSERAGKKAQYGKAKAILKATENQKFSAGIFIFYDQNGNFRFSLVYPESIGTTRQWNNFRRFTYFVSADPQITNKTFKQRIGDGDFLTLVKIKDAFSVEKVTKEFYEDIANWYFWAVDHCQFPKDAEKDQNGRDSISVIRLITRIIFIWFMREKNQLVPKNLFKVNNIQEILKDTSPESSTYYQAILQNLFFATLSTKKEERNFGSEERFNKGWNKDYDNQYVFRYHELFKNPDDIQKYFDNIPFLNGGLFECLDDKRNGIIIDGFSRTKKNQPIVPNFLFFSQEKEADLNKSYGTKGKTYKVRGLLDILSSFNFTIDENSPDDQDIALDPELLGRVFENLLASFNPETSTTARKATGSYYTPREIVDYMVAESLKAYFKTHLSNSSVIARSEATKQSLDEKLEKLFSTAGEENPFDAQESKKLVELIESVKIVDPAVGSGAFPMGALNKLVFILNKVDPGNELWKQAQLKAADAIPDPSVRRYAKVRIEEFFQGKNADYGRKLYLIQRCIYGVDIQQIAVEIAKLRFFISLLVDEKIDQSKDNWGIEPLPNLDFKIMQGNSLISEFLGFDFDNGHDKQSEQAQAALLPEQEDDSLIKEFEQKKIDFQNESDKDKNKNLKEEVEDLLIKIFEQQLQKKYAELKPIEEKAQSFPNLKMREEYIQAEKAKVAKKHGLDLKNIEKQLREFTSKKKTRPFFPWKLYFAEVFEKGGFDIVIANPPYIGEKGHKEIFREVKNGGSLSKYYLGKMDLFYFFFHLALGLGRPDSQVAFITTNYYPTAQGARKLREEFKNRTIIKKLINFNELKIFKSATGQHNIVTILSKGQDNNAIAKNCITKRVGDANSETLNSIVGWNDDKTSYFEILQQDLYDGGEHYIRLAGNSIMSDDPIQKILGNIRSSGVLLGTICNVNNGVFSGADKLSLNKKNKYKINAFEGDGVFILTNEEVKKTNLQMNEIKLIKPLYKNSDIKKYYTNSKNDLNLINLRYTDRPNLDDYPNIKKHLIKFKELLIDRPKTGTLESAFNNGYWYVMSTSRKLNFDEAKIVFPQRSDTNTFGYNETTWYAMSDVFFITKKEKYNKNLKYILALLNSKLYYLWLYFRGKRKGEILELTGNPVSEIPIKMISESEQKPFIEIVDKILAITKSGDYLENSEKQTQVKEYGKQIDQMVYKLYDLTLEEIEIVENSSKKS